MLTREKMGSTRRVYRKVPRNQHRIYLINHRLCQTRANQVSTVRHGTWRFLLAVSGSLIL